MAQLLHLSVYWYHHRHYNHHHHHHEWIVWHWAINAHTKTSSTTTTFGAAYLRTVFYDNYATYPDSRQVEISGLTGDIRFNEDGKRQNYTLHVVEMTVHRHVTMCLYTQPETQPKVVNHNKLRKQTELHPFPSTPNFLSSWLVKVTYGEANCFSTASFAQQAINVDRNPTGTMFYSIIPTVASE